VIALVGLSSRWSVSDLDPLVASRDVHERRAAALLLGATTEPSSIDGLAKLMTDESWEVRQATAASLGKLGRPEGIPVLEAARNDTNPVVRGAVSGAIICILPPPGRPVVMRNQPLPKKTLADWFKLITTPFVAARIPGVPRRAANFGYPRQSASVPGKGLAAGRPANPLASQPPKPVSMVPPPPPPNMRGGCGVLPPSPAPAPAEGGGEGRAPVMGGSAPPGEGRTPVQDGGGSGEGQGGGSAPGTTPGPSSEAPPAQEGGSTPGTGEAAGTVSPSVVPERESGDVVEGATSEDPESDEVQAEITRLLLSLQTLDL
jgi:hypothetical protein